jgi:D-cysteine desulfhydrase
VTAPRAIVEAFPGLAGTLPLASLAELPTPLEPLDGVARALGGAAGELFVKRDDLTSALYGGNKLRTLEVLFGQALAAGASEIWSTGAFGSNHATATVLHAPRAGLRAGVLLFPQPASWTALANLRATLSARPEARPLRHWSALPFGMWRARRLARRAGVLRTVMVPGGATPAGALGYVSAAFELGRQVQGGLLPPPARVVVGAGSTCTSAGLLAGLALAARLGVGFRDAAGRPAPPLLVSVRVTPWPVTARFRIVGLAVRASRLLARLAGDPSLALAPDELRAAVVVDGRFLGRGYGHATASGLEAIRLWREHVGFELDTTYSSKSAAAVVALLRARRPGPIVYWATKSTAPLPALDAAAIADAPPAMRRWIEQSEHALRSAGIVPEGI